MSKKLTQRDMAGILRVDTKTLYNWRKNKPELYRIVMSGFKLQEILENLKEDIKELEETLKPKEDAKEVKKVSKPRMKF